MKDKLKGLVIGILIGSTITGATAFAANTTPIKAVIQKINLYVDGNKKATANAITYNNTTYVPVRSMGKAIGEKVSLKGENLYIGKQPTVKVSLDDAFDLVYNKIKKDADKYKLSFMEDGTASGKYVIRVFENYPDHIATYGWYQVDMYSGAVYYYDLVNDKYIKL
ncbi:stalk domain-containing protein [Paenibacillus illinoisensis]|uniref:stalk domain-containing protein n=1 Tax=Paenibacillus illinoisensis TaxID=59845 RepID=UPI00301C7552